MKVDLLLVQAAILFLPGIIWARLDARYALKRSPSDSEFVLRAVVFGLASYAGTFVIYLALGLPFTVVDLGAAGTKTVLTGAVGIEILCAIVVGFVLAVLWIYAATYKWLTRFLHRIRATKTYGDEDVWDFTFNSSLPAVEYINFRDFEKKVVYSGWVRTFSETERLRELVLRDARVFDFDGHLMFEMPLLTLQESRTMCTSSSRPPGYSHEPGHEKSRRRP